MAEINFQKIEKKWQKKWEKEKIFCTQSVPFKEGKVKEEAGRREAYPNTLKGTRVRN